MSRNSSPASKINKNQQAKLGQNEQLIASLAAIPAIASGVEISPSKNIQKHSKDNLANVSDAEELVSAENSDLEQAVGPELAMIDEALLDLALLEDSEYTLTSNKKQNDDDDDGAWWWLKGLALLGGIGGIALLLDGGGSGSTPAPVPAEEYDHASFLDNDNGFDSRDDVLIMSSDLTVANLTLVAPENEQTFDSSGGIEGDLRDESANSQYLFMGEDDSNIRTLNLHVSDEDNVSLGLFLDSTLDYSGGVVESLSVIESVNILVDDASILGAANYFVEQSGGENVTIDNLINSEVGGRSFTVEVTDESIVYANDLINSKAYSQDDDVATTIAVALDDDSSAWMDDDLVDYSGDTVNIGIGLTDSEVFARDSLLEINSSNSDVVANINISDSMVGTDIGHLVDVRGAQNLDLTVTITSDSLVGNELAFGEDNGLGIISGPIDFPAELLVGGELFRYDETLDMLGYLTETNLVNVQGSRLSDMEIDVTVEGSILLTDNNIISVTSGLPSSEATQSDISLTLNTVFAVNGGDVIAVNKHDSVVTLNLENNSTINLPTYEDEEDSEPEYLPYAYSLTITGDDFIDVVGDNSIVNVTISDNQEVDQEAYQIHFVTDDFVEILGSNSTVTFNMNGDSAIFFEGYSNSALIDIDGPQSHTVNITMGDSSLIDGADYTDINGGSFSLVNIDNELSGIVDGDEVVWNGASNSSVTLTMSNDSEIVSYRSDNYMEDSYNDLIRVDSSNAQVNVTLNDDALIDYDGGNIIEVNTNLYNSSAYASGRSDVTLTINDSAQIYSEESLIDMEYEHLYYVGQDSYRDDLLDGYLDYIFSGGSPEDYLGIPSTTFVTLTLDGGDDLSGGAYAFADDNLIELDNLDFYSDFSGGEYEISSNAFSAESLNRDVRLSLSNATAESDSHSIEIDDLIGFDVRVNLENESSLDTDGVINAENVWFSYFELIAKDDSLIELNDSDLNDALIYIDESISTRAFIDLEDVELVQDNYEDDGFAIFAGEDSSDLNIEVTLENISGEDELQILNLRNVNESTFNVEIRNSLNDADEIYFKLGENNGNGADAATNNVLDLTLVDLTDNGVNDLDDAFINVFGDTSGGYFNTVNLTLQESELGEVDIIQSFNGDDYLMKSDIYLESSSINDLYLNFDQTTSDIDSYGGNAEVWINLLNSQIDSAELYATDVDTFDLYTQGISSGDTSFIQLDVNLGLSGGAVGEFSVYSLGDNNVDYQINYSSGNDIVWVNANMNNQYTLTTINLANHEDISGGFGALNYDYLDIRNIFHTKVNHFETESSRDKIYSSVAFTVQKLEFSDLDSDLSSGGGVEDYYSPLNISNTAGDDYYFYEGKTFTELLDDLTFNDTDDVNNYPNLGDIIDTENGLGNTYFVINGGDGNDDVEIYQWLSDGDDLVHKMTITDMNYADIVSTATAFNSYDT